MYISAPRPEIINELIYLHASFQFGSERATMFHIPYITLLASFPTTKKCFRHINLLSHLIFLVLEFVLVLMLLVCMLMFVMLVMLLSRLLYLLFANRLFLFSFTFAFLF